VSAEHRAAGCEVRNCTAAAADSVDMPDGSFRLVCGSCLGMVLARMKDERRRQELLEAGAFEASPDRVCQVTTCGELARRNSRWCLACGCRRLGLEVPVPFPFDIDRAEEVNQ